MAEGEVVVSDEEPIAGATLEDDTNLAGVNELLETLSADDLDMTVQRDLRAFSPTQKIFLRAALTTMIAAEDAIEEKLTREALSDDSWLKIFDVFPGRGRRDFREKDGKATVHRARARYFRELLSQIGA